MNATVQAPRSQADGQSRNYLALEEPIRNLTYMAGIAMDLAFELLDLEEPEAEEIVLRMSKRERAQFFFAINKAHDMALDLDRLYHGRLEEGWS